MQLKILLYNFFPVPLDTDSFWEAQHEGIDVERMHRRLHPSRQHLRYMSTQFQLDSENKSSSYTPTTSPFVVEPYFVAFFRRERAGILALTHLQGHSDKNFSGLCAQGMLVWCRVSFLMIRTMVITLALHAIGRGLVGMTTRFRTPPRVNFCFCSP